MSSVFINTPIYMCSYIYFNMYFLTSIAYIYQGVEPIWFCSPSLYLLGFHYDNLLAIDDIDYVFIEKVTIQTG
jgi:hypothetical protein